ncbi:MAG: OmpA family protein [Bryobacterales bacterium]|nr:OmpA family protein [Bryobacterales bacterium]
MTERAATLRSNSQTGMAMEFDAASERYLLSPTTGPEKNTLRAGLFPIACWRLDDNCFPFGSSFVVPESQPEFTELAMLMKDHPGAPLSLFGHADPVGSEEFNKQLSGRRALAVYGLLLRDVKIWEKLYDNRLAPDDWHNYAIPRIRQTLNEPGSGEGTAASRAELYRRYMDWLSRFEDGTPFRLEKSHFLAQGVDAGGKGDYQGCSEFNPVLIFSKQQSDLYAAATDKTARNAANAPNRRVSALLFRPGTRVTPEKWPCPRASEAVAGCRKRFWSDAQQRLTPGPAKRQWQDTKDTFACRFYDRIAGDSPCESVARNTILIQLLYEDETPMANAKFEAVFGDVRLNGATDAKGKAVIEPPEGAEEPFELFLLEFPEAFVDPEPAAATAGHDEGRKRAARYWPENILGSLAFAFLLSALPAPSAEPVEVTLRGPLYSTGEPAQLSMTLRLDPRKPAGTVEFPAGESGRRFTMTRVSLVVQEQQKSAVVERVRYRLRYAINTCEHARPIAPHSPVTHWDPCRFTAADRRPSQLVSGEALLTREKSPGGEYFVAAGVPDVRDLWGVFRATGRIAP